MPTGLASLVLQTQAFFTILLGTFLLSEKLRCNHIIGILIATIGVIILTTAHTDEQASVGVTFITMILTLAAALSWGLGNITNKIILKNHKVSMMSLVIWGALVPIPPLYACSWWFEGEKVIASSLLNISFQTIASLFYLAFIATFVGYTVWGRLLDRYETWRVAPLSLLVPVVGIISAMLTFGENCQLEKLLEL